MGSKASRLTPLYAPCCSVAGRTAILCATPFIISIQVVIASEFRDPERDQTFSALEDEFMPQAGPAVFKRLIQTVHKMDDSAVEVAGKSSNENHAVRELYKIKTAEGVDPSKASAPQPLYRYLRLTSSIFSRCWSPLPMRTRYLHPSILHSWISPGRAIPPLRLYAKHYSHCYVRTHPWLGPGTDCLVGT